MVFCFQGELWVSVHYAVFFGATSAVYAWHRVGNFITYILRTLPKCPVGRYVDDFFGASRAGLYWHGGRMIDVSSALLGFPCDDSKSASEAMEMAKRRMRR